MQTNATSRTL